MEAKDAKKLLEEHVELIARLARFVCKHKLDPSEADDFQGFVNLRLCDNEYGILRKFEGRCSMPTYLTVVIKRLFSDYQIHHHGKWHTSAAAARLGEDAVELERLLHRDHKPLDEAVAQMMASKPARSRAELARIAERLPERRAQTSFVSADDVEGELAVTAEPIEAEAASAERRKLRELIDETLRGGLAELPAEDLTILRLLFVQEMTVADIARMLHTEQKPLYRRIRATCERLRRSLIDAGVAPDDAKEILGRHDTTLDFGLRAMGNPPLRSSDLNGSDGRGRGA